MLDVPDDPAAAEGDARPTPPFARRLKFNFVNGSAACNSAALTSAAAVVEDVMDVAEEAAINSIRRYGLLSVQLDGLYPPDASEGGWGTTTF